MTNMALDVTNRWPSVTGVAQTWRAMTPARQQLWLWWAALAPVAAVNALSAGADLARRGLRFHPVEPWIWEVSSVLMIALLLASVLRWDQWLLRRTRRGAGWLLAHLAGSMVFSLAHVAGMMSLRKAVYLLAGWHYDAGPWLERLVYEYRKDVLVYAGIVAMLWVWTRAARSAAPAVSAAPTFLVRSGSAEEVVRAGDIDWVQAQGNYVALHVDGKVRLLRETLADMEVALLPHGFLRTHRSALVNGRRVQAIHRSEDGRLELRMAGAQAAPLTAARRAEVARALRGDPALER